MAAAVGTVSQLMIFTEPASAVSHPSPTPATADRIANTTAKTSSDAAAAARSARAERYPRRSRRSRAHTHTRKGSAMPAVALTAMATVISAVPATWRPPNVSAMPAAIRPTISISLCTPPIRWMSASGLSTQIHSAVEGSAPRCRATRGVAQINSARPGSMHSRSNMVPATTLLPTRTVISFATRMNAGP